MPIRAARPAISAKGEPTVSPITKYTVEPRITATTHPKVFGFFICAPYRILVVGNNTLKGLLMLRAATIVLVTI